MQKIIIEKPYTFVPPYRGRFWTWLVQRTKLYTRWLHKTEGVWEHEVRHIERLQESLARGHSVMLTPNHARQADPLAMGWLADKAKTDVFAMASWHLFNQDWFTGWAIRRMGAFSVNREGVDRQAINVAVEILETAERPLVIFPEGAVSRTNDRLQAMLDGVAFIARTAAKKRAKQGLPPVVVHPVAIKYYFNGDILKACDDVLGDIEARLTWRRQSHLSVPERIVKVGHALLSLKELEYFGKSGEGPLAERQWKLIDRLLQPLEREWLGGPRSGNVVPRVKAIRVQMLPEMVQGKLDENERQRRWRQLEDCYLAQQVSCYPPDYLVTLPSVDRYLETIERFEEDLTDKARVHGHLKVVMDVGEAIEVSPERDRKAPVDPVMEAISTRLQGMLDALAADSRMLPELSLPGKPGPVSAPGEEWQPRAGSPGDDSPQLATGDGAAPPQVPRADSEEASNA